MSVVVKDINALVVLNEWALDMGHDAPVYQTIDNSVTVQDVPDTEVQAVLDAVDAVAIADAQSRVVIRSFQMMSPRPKNANLAALKVWALGVATQVIAHLRSRSTRSADAVTLAGWGDKLILAERVIATTATTDEVAIIQSEADMRGLGETANDLAVKVIAKANLLRAIRSQIDGFEDRVLREINAVADVPSFNAVMSGLVADGSAIITALSV